MGSNGYFDRGQNLNQTNAAVHSQRHCWVIRVDFDVRSMSGYEVISEMPVVRFRRLKARRVGRDSSAQTGA
jgi:hypothetical protein